MHHKDIEVQLQSALQSNLWAGHVGIDAERDGDLVGRSRSADGNRIDALRTARDVWAACITLDNAGSSHYQFGRFRRADYPAPSQVVSIGGCVIATATHRYDGESFSFSFYSKANIATIRTQVDYDTGRLSLRIRHVTTLAWMSSSFE